MLKIGKKNKKKIETPRRISSKAIKSIWFATGRGQRKERIKLI